MPESPSAVGSWQDHFFAVRRRYFVAGFCWTAVAVGLTTVVMELPLVHPARGVQAFFLVGNAVGAASSNHRVQGTLAALFLGACLATFCLLLVPENLTGS